MERLLPGVLLELDRRERAVGRPDRRVGLAHGVEGLLAGLDGRGEALGLHRPGAVVAGAFERGHRSDAGDLAEQVARPEPDALRPQVAGRVVGHLLARRGAEVGVEPLLPAEAPEVLRRVAHRFGQPPRGFPLLRRDERRVLLAHEHGAGGVHRDHPGTGLDEGGEEFQVAPRRTPQGVEVAALPGRHPAAGEAGDAVRLHPVPVEHFEGVPADLRFVVLDIAGGEQHRLPARRRGRPALRRPVVEGLAGEGRQEFLPVDADRLLQTPPRRPGVRRLRGHHRQEALHPARPVGVGEHPAAQRGAAPGRCLRPADGGVAVDQVREVQLELVPLPRGVGAGELALLALEAAGHDPVLLPVGERPRVAVPRLVHDPEQVAETVAVLEAHAAAVADVERPVHLGAQAGRVEVPLLRRVVAEVRPRQHRRRRLRGRRCRSRGAGMRLRQGTPPPVRAAGRRPSRSLRTGAPAAGRQTKSSSRDWNRPAWDFSAFASVSNQSAISPKPSSRAVLAIPGYMSVYS